MVCRRISTLVGLCIWLLTDEKIISPTKSNESELLQKCSSTSKSTESAKPSRRKSTGSKPGALDWARRRRSEATAKSICVGWTGGRR